MDGVKMSCVYSWNCDRAKGSGVSGVLLNFAKKSEADIQKIRAILLSLEIGKFYRKIAEVNSVPDFFDASIVSYYWTGRPDLAGELWHNYTTLLPLLAVPFPLLKIELIDDCLVRSGEVTKVREGGLAVRYHPLIKNETELSVSGSFQEKNIGKEFGGHVKEGDLVTFHFSSFTGSIDSDGVRTLDKITERSLRKFNNEHK